MIGGVRAAARRAPAAACRVIGAAVCALALWPATARAQTAPPGGRFEVAAGGLWIQGASVGGADATETAPDGSRFRLFASRGSLGPAAGLEGRVGVRLGTVLRVEGSGSFAKPDLRVRISSDVEGVSDLTLAETVSQWTIEAALVAYLARWRVGPRGVPFVSAGAGYLRQIHEGGTLAENGRTYRVGGGVDYPLARAGTGRLKSAGLRVDVRAAISTGGAGFDDRVRVAPVAGASLFVRF